MTAKGTKELLTGDTATLIARALIILGLTWNGMKQEATKENTEDIKTTLSVLKTRQDATDQRISRNEILDGNEHSHLRQTMDEHRREFQNFKEKYFFSSQTIQP